MRASFAIATFFAAGMGGALLLSTAAGADSPRDVSASRPWEKAQAVLSATETDLAKGGLRTVGAHASDLEQALADARRSFEVARAGTGTIYVLADGQAETLAGLMAATAAKRNAVAVRNPYPHVSFYLGSYYNEIGRSADALRVLDAGLALPRVVQDAALGETLPALISERGATLTALKRWSDALAAFDGGLTIATLNNTMRARMLRGRGFCLTELGRLDDAEKSYRDSLIIEPNNPRALKELDYIARLRAGGPTAPSKLIPIAPPKPQ